MNHSKEFEKFDRIGVEKDRSYYIPFFDGDKVKYHYGIIDRNSSSRFISLDGEWGIKQLENIEKVDISEPISRKIAVPSCVQMNGYDKIQYINSRYPFPVNPPFTPYENPCWHYRKTFDFAKKDGEKYYINFEGVDSAFYLFVNGKRKGYSQISHATSEFDVTDLLISGENVIDVVVLKWCASSYLECQDKFRFSGIFRSVYILSRPEKHITDYFIKTDIIGDGGVLRFENESPIGVSVEFNYKKAFVESGKSVEFFVNQVKTWTAENPYLYSLTISAQGEKIYEKVGFRKITIENKTLKLNGNILKLKGVNRHEFNPQTGATISLKDIVKDLKLMKFLNVNAIRTSHYPNCPEFYALCDRLGFYVMDEADLETHGAVALQGEYDLKLWSDYAENETFTQGVFERHKTLVERDKNRTSVIMWSLGNESSFGKAFFKGCKYIKRRDDRPVHYEGLLNANKKYYYSKYVDVVSMMYPSLQTIQERVLDNPKETRPFVLCEYTHAMGNSCGDIADYWKMIYANNQLIGAFVWEWADHAVKTKKGFLYGGDFGECEHDENFCVDGLLSPDRKIKSNAYEMQAVYGGKIENAVKEIEIPKLSATEKDIEIKVEEYSGKLISLLVGGREVLKTPLKLNAIRYIDNDRKLQQAWVEKYNLSGLTQQIRECQKLKNGYKFKGYLASNCHSPAVNFNLAYLIENGALKIEIEYGIADFIRSLPRIGFEFAIDKQFADFSYIGFGPYESYVDKNMACEYGYYESDAYKNYDRNYVRPQESGSHYFSKYLHIKDVFFLTAEIPFSFSVTPYTTEQLCKTLHDFELKENPFVNVCVDLAMRGVGSFSCGPELDEKNECKRSGKNTFKFEF